MADTTLNVWDVVKHWQGQIVALMEDPEGNSRVVLTFPTLAERQGFSHALKSWEDVTRVSRTFPENYLEITFY